MVTRCPDVSAFDLLLQVGGRTHVRPLSSAHRRADGIILRLRSDSLWTTRRSDVLTDFIRQWVLYALISASMIDRPGIWPDAHLLCHGILGRARRDRASRN